MCDKAVSTYPSTIKFIPECFTTQKICHKVVNICFFVFDCIPDQYKTQEMCDTVASEDPSLIVHYPDKYEIQTMCDKAVDDCLAALTLVPYWFVTSKMIITFLLLCMQMKICSTLMRVLVMQYVTVMEWVFLI